MLNLVSSDEYYNSTLNLSVFIKEPIALVEISPTSINFGEITKGYVTNFSNVSVINRGDLDIRIKPTLREGAPQIFQNLKFSSASCSNWYGLGWNSSIISRAEEYGRGNGERYNFCIRLDLRNYQEEILESANLSTELIIWIIPL
ncbi:MAG: hypothetical protein QXU40_01080 [Candidatus Pacearchaeota archaeon]